MCHAFLPLPAGLFRLAAAKAGDSPRVYSSNSQCDRQRGVFALSKTFFRRNTDVFQGKMARRSVKRPAVRVRWELEEYTLSTCRQLGRGDNIGVIKTLFPL